MGRGMSLAKLVISRVRGQRQAFYELSLSRRKYGAGLGSFFHDDGFTKACSAVSFCCRLQLSVCDVTVYRIWRSACMDVLYQRPDTAT